MCCIVTTDDLPDSKVHVAHMGPTWALLAPGGPHVGPMNLAIWVGAMVVIPQFVLTMLVGRHLSEVT